MSNILNFLYPVRCPACRRVIEDDTELIHKDCRKRFKLIEEPRCFKCGRHIYDRETALCDECRKNKHLYDYGLPLFEYNETARSAMIDFKKNGNKRNGLFFADTFVRNLGKRLLAFKPEVLIPVPSSNRRIGERGFNQAEFLADMIGERLGIPVDAGVLERRKGRDQKELSREERIENALKSFECSCEIDYKRVCIVDDIYTTGSTIEGCVRVLKNAGVCEAGFITVFAGDMV